MKRRRLMSEINVVPYIDVMLVLLVIFMVTAPMLSQGVKVNLPQSESKPVTSKKPPLIVTVSANGQSYVQDKAASGQALVDKVKAERDAEPGLQVLVRGDRDANYGRVVEVMTLLQTAGVNDVGLLTEAPASAGARTQTP